MIRFLILPVLLRTATISLVLGGLLSAEQPAKFNRVLKLGSPAPNWKELPQVEGDPLRLADLRDSNAVVLFFTHNHCPISRKYAPRIRELSEQFAERKVTFVAVNVGSQPGEELESMRKKRQDFGWNFPYAKDSLGKLAAEYGATATPQFFLLDERRHVVYMGAFDDHPDPAKVQEPYLKWALEQLLEGREIEIPESRPVGCEIKSTSALSLE